MRLVFDYTEPINKAFFLRFEDGQIAEVKETDSDGSEESDYALHGSPDTWRSVLDGSISPMKALTGGKLKVDGSMMGLMKQMKAFNHVLDSLQKVPLT